MAIYNGAFYPDTQALTWANIAGYTWTHGNLNWLTFNSAAANSVSSISYTTDATDYGYAKWFYPETTVVWDDEKIVNISYQYSTDGANYTTTNAAPMYGRYLKTTVNTAGKYLNSIQTYIRTEPRFESYYNLDLTTLTGNTSHRTLYTNNFSQIQSVTITSGQNETRPLSGKLVQNNTGNIVIRAIDLDTWDKVSVDANVNIVIVGFPTLQSNSIQGKVYPAT